MQQKAIPMKKEDMRRWMADYLTTQRRLTMGSTGAMAAIGAIATLVEFMAVLLIIRIGFIGSWILATLVTIGILAAVQFLTWLRLPKQLPDIEHEVELEESSALFRIPPGMPLVWTYGFGSLDTDQTRIELLLGVLAMPQRMCCAAWFAWQRFQELKSVDVDSSAAVIRMLHKKAERIDVKVLTAELELSNPAKTIRDVSLIDGVVLLTRGTLGMSLANRLMDDLAEWQKKQSAAADG